MGKWRCDFRGLQVDKSRVFKGRGLLCIRDYVLLRFKEGLGGCIWNLYLRWPTVHSVWAGASSRRW